MQLGDRLHWEINPEYYAMQITQQKTIHVDVTELRLHIKVSDRFDGGLVDAQGDEVVAYSGYVPDFFPGNHYGDYLILNINLETGQITNWKTPSASDIEAMIKKGDDE